MRLFSSWIWNSKKIPHHRKLLHRPEGNHSHSIDLHTLGELGFGAVHSVDIAFVYFMLKTPRAGRWVLGKSEGQLLPKGQGAKCDNTAKRTVASPARAHPTLPEQGKQDRPKGGGQGQPRIQITTQVCSDKTGLRSSWEVTPLVRVKFSESNEGLTQHGDCQADILLPNLSLIDRMKTVVSSVV